MKKTKITPMKYDELSKTEFDKLCIEFFIEVDPSLKWLKIYNQLKQENKIRKDEKSTHATCAVDSKDDIKIYIPQNEPISDFPNFINAFASYVSFSNCDVGPIDSSEVISFPATFFEMYASLFLKKEGYLDASSRISQTQKNALAIQALEKVGQDPYLMYTILEITENLSQETKESINEKLGISAIETTKIIKNLQYKK